MKICQTIFNFDVSLNSVIFFVQIQDFDQILTFIAPLPFPKKVIVLVTTSPLRP